MVTFYTLSTRRSIVLHSITLSVLNNSNYISPLWEREYQFYSGTKKELWDKKSILLHITALKGLHVRARYTSRWGYSSMSSLYSVETLTWYSHRYTEWFATFGYTHRDLFQWARQGWESQRLDLMTSMMAGKFRTHNEWFHFSSCAQIGTILAFVQWNSLAWSIQTYRDL